MPSNPTPSPLPQGLCSKFCHPELVERIFMWRSRVHSNSSTELPLVKTTGTKLKARHQKPYSRPVSSIRSRTSYNRGCNLPEPASDALVPVALHVNSSNHLSTSDTSQPVVALRGSYQTELPDPVQKPLISNNPSYLAGEYCRIMLLHDRLQIQRRQLEIACLRKVGDRDITQQLLEIGAAIQRITKSTRYIVDRSQEFGFNLDFSAIYVRYCDQVLESSKPKPEQKPDENFIKMPQARAFSDAWKFNPL